MKLNSKTIWNCEQNKPSLIVNDLWEMHRVPKKETFRILLVRGVFKWLSVRRDLIKLKNVWKEKIVNLNKQVTEFRKVVSNNNNPAMHYKWGYMRGYKKAMEECRADVRTLCHSERWRAPDFDKEAQEYLKELESENENQVA